MLCIRTGIPRPTYHQIIKNDGVAYILSKYLILHTF